MKKKLDSFRLLSSRILVWSAPVACTVERASGGVEYVYRGIKREDGVLPNQESGYPVVLIIPGPGPYGYGRELRRLAG